MRARRGNCGAPFSSETPMADQDEQGRWMVEGGDIVGYRSSAADVTFTSCPLAATYQPWLASILRTARHCAGDVSRVYTMACRPSATLIDMVEAATTETAALHAYQAEMRRKDAARAKGR